MFFLIYIFKDIFLMSLNTMRQIRNDKSEVGTTVEEKKMTENVQTI